MTDLPDRDQLIQQVGVTVSSHEKDEAVRRIVDDVLAPYLVTFGSLNERRRTAEAVTHASQRWADANRRQVATIDRLLDANRELKAQHRVELEQLENVALDLNQRYDQLADAVGEVDSGD